ncbi:phosphopantetheine-binding protein [Yinghuangia seranimata]|uniref:phosphopantetheine-binding protein n=1 Tax=Yinghuangia seranimata TaxID=408067 RepID=UPI00248CEC47|nr:phosphopantetheine-binding protein [Yinghuangia seranimata]MDI2128390.1 phosphopantetheine-binding protein [Yinghuangia seranimata]
MDAFESRIIAVVADELGIPESEVTPASRFADDFGVDEFGIAGLALRLGDELDADVALSHEDVEAVESVGDLIDAVRRLAPQTI